MQELQCQCIILCSEYTRHFEEIYVARRKIAEQSVSTGSKDFLKLSILFFSEMNRLFDSPHLASKLQVTGWSNKSLKSALYSRLKHRKVFKTAQDVFQVSKHPEVLRKRSESSDKACWDKYELLFSVRRQLISSDNSYQATTHINLKKRQLISSDNSYQ